MGAADIRTAFNAAADGQLVASQALLSYERVDGKDHQRLVFKGTDADGKTFSTKSELIPPGGNVLDMARATALSLLKGDAA